MQIHLRSTCHWRLCWRRDLREPARSLSEKPTGVRAAQQAASNLDNRYVEIVCAASARVNVSVFYQFVDTTNRPWPTSVALCGGESRSGSAWLGLQKDGLPACRGDMVFSSVQGHQLAHRGGAA